jgi:hypothetical protein
LQNLYSSAGLLPSLSHLTSCTPTNTNLHFEVFLCRCPKRTCRIHTSNIPSTKCHSHFLLHRSFIQGISPGTRLLDNFGNKLIFLASRQTPKMEVHHLSAVRDCLFNTFAAALHICRASAPSASWGRAMPWWEETQQHRFSPLRDERETTSEITCFQFKKWMDGHDRNIWPNTLCHINIVRWILQIFRGNMSPFHSTWKSKPSRNSGISRLQSEQVTPKVQDTRRPVS